LNLVDNRVRSLPPRSERVTMEMDDETGGTEDDLALAMAVRDGTASFSGLAR
jgi:hypothetical protein